MFPGSILDAAATKRAMGVTMCGHKTTLYRFYNVQKGVSVKSVIAWYGRMLPGASFVGPADGIAAGGTYIAQDTTRGVTILQAMAYSPAADAIGADRVSYSFIRYEPALGQPYVDIMVKASRGDKAARDQFKRMCPKDPS